jgi:hypothetical protein
MPGYSWRNHPLDLRQQSALLLWQRCTVLAGMKENCAAALTPRIKGVIAPSFSADADLSGIVFDGRKNSSFF